MSFYEQASWAFTLIVTKNIFLNREYLSRFFVIFIEERFCLIKFRSYAVGQFIFFSVYFLFG